METALPENGDAASTRNEIIKHLPNEISKHTEYLATLRSKLAFTVLAGPFVILGYVLVTIKPTPTTNYWRWHWQQTLACTFVGVLYLLLGYYGSKIDQHGTDQCNKWRRAILKASDGKALNESDLLIADPLFAPYMVGFVTVLLVFLSIGWLLLSLFPNPNLK
jgi:hypothetical protein